MIRWGILGLGNMGNHFSNAAKEVNDIKINGIASLSENKLKKFSERLSIPKKNCFNSYDELINSDLVDAIYISTLNKKRLTIRRFYSHLSVVFLPSVSAISLHKCIQFHST